jgi:small subunit ribosomal protein S2
MTDVDLKTLFEAGAHFGHKTSRWHPKMERYIHSAKNGIHIINLEKTLEMLEPALKFLEQTAMSGKQVLFVGTKRQAQSVIEKYAEGTNSPYVTVRWFGGMLTNLKTMQQRIKRLKDLEAKMESGELASRYSKLEVQRFQEEIDQLNRDFGGIKDMAGTPGAIYIIDAQAEHNAVREANKLSVPIVALVDTNANPTAIDYPIPANDDAIKAIELITSLVAEAVAKGKAEHRVTAKAAAATKEPADAKEE